ncbi:MAG: PDZ domain-containing protein [Oscillospiraceae bacterium]|nr:PDZ domain-containing protein [Oscillospiraceae bacterium]
MNKKIPISLALAIAIVAMTITFCITMIVSMKRFDSTVTAVTEKETMYDKIAEVDKSVRDNYYGTIDDKLLYDTLGAGYLAGLGDKYAKYYTAAQYNAYLKTAAGKVMGIGVDVVKDATGYARVLTVYADSPAAEAGITVGSYITALDGVEVKALSNEAIRTLLQGEEGTVVKVSLLSADFTTESAQDLSRRAYRVPSVRSELLNTTGYIRIRSFNEYTPSEFDAELQMLLTGGITGLVLDLRGNAGNDIENMVRVLDVLCPAAEVGNAVYKNGDTVSLGVTTDESSIQVPVVLITNSSTASAAELFCVTLRDVISARIVGVKTAGRGTVQTIIEQTDGSALEFTVAVMVPDNEAFVFDGVGVTPDFEIALSAAEEANSYELTVATDPQILRAFEMLDTMTGASTAAGMQGGSTDEENTGSESEGEDIDVENAFEGFGDESVAEENPAESEAGDAAAESESSTG